MFAKVTRPFVVLFRPVTFVVVRIFRVFAWLQGSSNPNRYSRSYRAHQNAIERKHRHR
jgi:hypothetical protein